MVPDAGVESLRAWSQEQPGQFCVPAAWQGCTTGALGCQRAEGKAQMVARLQDVGKAREALSGSDGGLGAGCLLRPLELPPRTWQAYPYTTLCSGLSPAHGWPCSLAGRP